jgi:decaprenyl-phosphate phosphoribosyltransferase
MKNRRKTGEARKGLRDRIRAHIAICRFDHWIKNIFVVPGILVALPFVRHSDIGVLIAKTILGLLAIGLITSSNYVINELLDAPYDRNHPRKYLRPVAAGRIIIPIAYGQWLLLMLAGLALGQLISLPFAVILLVLWIMGCLYNIPPLRAKDVPYLDVLSESVNNPLRMLAGWYIVDPGMFPSTNLLLSYWMLGAYLMSLKRLNCAT